jgi:hypothetical protein
LGEGGVTAVNSNYSTWMSSGSILYSDILLSTMFLLYNLAWAQGGGIKGKGGHTG